MKKINPVVWAVLAVPVIYMAMVLACSYEAGTDLFALMERFGLLLGRPDLLRWTAYTPRCILGALVCYGLAVTLYYLHQQIRWRDVQRLTERDEHRQAGNFCARLDLSQVGGVDAARFRQPFPCPAPLLTRHIDPLAKQLLIHVSPPSVCLKRFIYTLIAYIFLDAKNSDC